MRAKFEDTMKLNIIKLEISQADLEHIMNLIRKDIENSRDIFKIQVDLPLYEYLEEELKREVLKNEK